MDEPIAGALPHSYWLVENNHSQLIEGGMIEESLVSIYVNAQELATVMCSPLDQEALALGFLFNEGIINSLDEVGLVKANVPRATVDVFLTRSDFEPPRRMIITSGCGGGVTLQYLTESHPPLDSNFTTTSDIVFARMKDLQAAAKLYAEVRGVHTATLANTETALASAEDVGRHNAVDKVTGKALQAGIATRDCILLTSGRISSEMLSKARRMEIPLVVSRTAPTSIAVKLAEAWNLCVVGYVRRDTLRVYTHPWRLGLG
jgi:FdhD protein